MPKKYKQTWNSRSKKYVLIDCSEGIKGGMTGQMSNTPFEGVPIVKDKPNKNGSEHQDKKKKDETRKKNPTETEQPEKRQNNTPAENQELDDSNSGQDTGGLW